MTWYVGLEWFLEGGGGVWVLESEGGVWVLEGGGGAWVLESGGVVWCRRVELMSVHITATRHITSTLTHPSTLLHPGVGGWSGCVRWGGGCWMVYLGHWWGDVMCGVGVGWRVCRVLEVRRVLEGV